jgi:hypothetical protein
MSLACCGIADPPAGPVPARPRRPRRDGTCTRPLESRVEVGVDLFTQAGGGANQGG